MKTFRFPLDRILRWRRGQLDLERAATKAIVQRRSELESALKALVAARHALESAIVSAGAFRSQDLYTLSACQQRNVRERAALLAHRQVLARELAQQAAKTMEAERRVKLIERLRENRVGEWTRAMEKEQEDFAAEAWLGRWPVSPPA